MDENKQAILLLAAQFSPPKKGAPTPLTALEYGRFAAWMRQVGFQPLDLFHRFDEIVQLWQDPKRKVTSDRLQYLLGRGMAMGIAIEKWQRAGMWLLTRADQEYPIRLKKHLSDAAPAVLFGVGETALLNAGGVAMVGSRKIGATETQFTNLVARQAAQEGLNVVSGGARGVDETAMLASLETEGTAVGVLANDLFKSALSGKWRQYLRSSQLALVSPFYPEARFHVGSAMGRNKYIYCLSDYALVVRSEKDSGGTWAGATENLKEKNRWVPLFVAAPSAAAGNASLLGMGARQVQLPSPENLRSDNWLQRQLKGPVESKLPQHGSQETTESQNSFTTESTSLELPPRKFDDQSEIIAAEEKLAGSDTKSSIESAQSYEGFIQYVLEQVAESEEIKFSDLKKLRKDIKQKQIREWLDRAVKKGVLNRKGRLLTYTSNVAALDQKVFNFE